MSELEENLSAVALWIRCTFVVLCIYAGALLIAAGQILRQWLWPKPSTASARNVPPARTQGKVPGSV